MARAITMRHTIVPVAEREAFHARAVKSQAHYSKTGCNYWVFEESSLPGAYVEFFEARDADVLRSAHRESSEPSLESARLYVEVDLS